MAGEDAEDRVGVGATERDVEDRRALVHLPEQPAPRRLGPAGVGDRPVQVARAQILPEARGSDMAERVGLRVLDHLRVGDGAAREVQTAVGSSRPVGSSGVAPVADALGTAPRATASRRCARPTHRRVAQTRHRLVDLARAGRVGDRRRRARSEPNR